MEKSYTLYILICGNGAYYTGITSDLEKRMKAHQLVGIADTCYVKRWTKYHQPVELVFKYEGIENYPIALKVEQYVKSLKKESKKLLVNSDSYRFRMLLRMHRTHVTKFKLRANTASHSAQIPHPYIAHI